MLLLILHRCRKIWNKRCKILCSSCILSTQDNAKLPQQLKPGLSRTINWKKHQSDPKTYPQNRYLNHLVNPSFQGINKLFVLSFENENDRISQPTYYLPKVEIKDYDWW